MKKIVNAPAGVIEDYISGLVAASPHLSRVESWPVVVRTPAERKGDDRVALVSGGGSGHEPGHAGYVGHGMLDAAVLGPVFTSPSVDAVHAAIRAVATAAGVVLIVKNYTGDRLNFGLAAELARAEGIRVEMIVVADDAALGDSSRAGRRGLTGTVLAHKVAGAAAERGDDLDGVVRVTERLLAGTATMGVALGPCSAPGAERANFELGADEIEWGLGIHGEAGSERSGLVTSSEIAARLVDTVVADTNSATGSDVVVAVNSLGGTPDLELRILQGDVLRRVDGHGLRTRMTWAGPLLTSLEMPGASVTIARADAELLELLAAPARAAAFPRATDLLDDDRSLVVSVAQIPGLQRGEGAEPDVQRAATVVDAIAAAVVAASAELTDLDRRVGDGDLGTNLARGAQAVLAAGEILRSQSRIADYLAGVSDVLRREVGGTSGPLYSLLVLAVADELRDLESAPTAVDWIRAFRAGVARVREVGGADPGDSTMVDALQPAADALAGDTGEPRERLAAAAAAARAGAESTAALTPALGRSSYVGGRAVGVPDPGAVAIAVQLEAASAALADGGGS